MIDKSSDKCLSVAIEHLRSLISVPSFSNEENGAADLWEEWLRNQGAAVERFHNNVYCCSSHWDKLKPVLLLNSHLDTVMPCDSYSRDPFMAYIDGDILYGLGSNDAGGAGVSLAATFLRLKDREDLNVNLLFAITASEEKMGEFGMRAFLPHLKEKGLYPDMAIVGEPTDMQPAIAERGLMVLDCLSKGRSGHAARNEGVNAIYKALEDIEILRAFQPVKISNVLGPVKISVTMISAGSQHNVVPDICKYVADVRTTDAYSNEETVKMIREQLKHSEVNPRSTRIQASVIPEDHPLVKSALTLGLTPYISPTTSDMSLMHDIPSLKIGPGKSERSHTADEYILISEIEKAMEIYPELIFNLKF